MWTNLKLLLYLNGSIPFPSPGGDGNVLNRPTYWTALVKTYPAKLRQKDPTVVDLKSLWKPDAVA